MRTAAGRAIDAPPRHRRGATPAARTWIDRASRSPLAGHVVWRDMSDGARQLYDGAACSCCRRIMKDSA
jgi:hypothetical protein